MSAAVVKFVRFPAPATATCRHCGCDELHACRLPWGLCAWKSPGLCDNPACLVVEARARRERRIARKCARRRATMFAAVFLTVWALSMAVGLGFAWVARHWIPERPWAATVGAPRPGR